MSGFGRARLDKHDADRPEGMVWDEEFLWMEHDAIHRQKQSEE
jgi:hypothetical protein